MKIKKQNPAQGDTGSGGQETQKVSKESKSYPNFSTVSQLKLLGYGDADTVYYRAIGEKFSQKIEGHGFELPAKLQEASDRGKNLYLVVNGQGHRDADLAVGRAFFYEHDDLPKELQIDLWQTLGLPQPTFQVDTGGKSIHSYWVLGTPCPIADWKVLQADLLEFADADRTIKNPSRVMRLAGFKHQKTGQLATIASESGKRYSFDLLRSIVPSQKVDGLPLARPVVLGADRPPLQIALAKSSRDLIRGGAGEGSRNTSGAALARDLLGTAAALNALGITFEGDPRELFNQFCDRCSPPLGGREVDLIWKSAKSANPGASLSPDKIQTCVESWRRRQQSQVKGLGAAATPKTRVKAANRVVPLAQPEEEAPQNYEGAIRALAENPPAEDSDLKFAIDTIAQNYSRQPLEVERLFHAVSRETEEKEILADSASQIQRYLDIAEAGIDLDLLLGSKLASAFDRKAELLGADPAVMVNCLLSAEASLAPLGTTIDLGYYSAKPIFWSVGIGVSGTNKTGTQNTITAPLYALQIEAFAAHKEDKKFYDREKSEWEKSGRKGDEPVEPEAPRIYILETATTEAVRSIQCAQPKHGFVVAVDDGSSFFRSFDQYRNGRGGDKEFWLRLFNGEGITHATKKNGVETCPASGVSLLLNTQPETMQELFGDFSDGQGLVARFNPGSQKYRRRPRPTYRGERVDISNWLYDIYLRLSLQPVRQYRMDSEAFELFADFAEELKDKLEAETADAMRAVYSKQEKNVGVVTMGLHRIRAAAEGRDPEEVIGIEFVQAAIHHARFTLGQVEYMRRLALESSGEISAKLSKVLEVTERQGGKLKWGEAKKIRALEVLKYGGKKSPPNRQQVEKIFNQLVELGYGTTEGEGSEYCFKAKQKAVENFTLDYGTEVTIEYEA